MVLASTCGIDCAHELSLDTRAIMTAEGVMLQHTSEQMVVVNLTAEMISEFARRVGRRVSVIAPTTNEEQSLGFDGLFSGLPAGNLLALQFKRPYPHPRAEAKFT